MMADPPDLKFLVAFTHSCAPEELAVMKTLFLGTLKVEDSIICNIGPVIGTYSGTGALGVAYIAKGD